MELALLSDYPEHAPQIAQWYFDEWLAQVTGASVEAVLSKISHAYSGSTLRLMVIAKEGAKLLGVAELKEREMDIYPQFVHWLGGVYVDPEARGRGIASLLVNDVIRRARGFGIETLYLQTENLSGGLYTRLGFEALHRANYKGRVVLVMAANLNEKQRTWCNSDETRDKTCSG